MSKIITVMESSEFISPFDAIMESSSEELGGIYVTEGAKFSVLPSFKKYKDKYPDLAKYEDLMKDADDILSSKGEMAESTGTKIARVILRILGVIASIDSVILLPFCIFVFPILYLLITRLWKFAFEFLDYALAEKTSMETVKKLEKVAKTTDDKELKKKAEKLIKDIEANYKKMKEIDKKKAKEEDKDED